VKPHWSEIHRASADAIAADATDTTGDAGQEASLQDKTQSWSDNGKEGSLYDEASTDAADVENPEADKSVSD